MCRTPAIQQFFCFLGNIALLLALGCTGGREPSNDPGLPFEGVTLRVLVPGRPGLRTWLEDQRGEWEANTGAMVELIDWPATGKREPAQLNADVAFYSSTGMGKVIETVEPARLPENLRAEPEYDWNDIVLAARERLAEWDRRPCAVPILANCPLIYYRKDLFAVGDYARAFEQQFGRPLASPSTWEQFDQLAEFFHGRDSDGDGIPEGSLAVADLAEAFLCRAAAYGKHPQYFSFYFDLSSMEPLLEEPPFRQALEEWLEASRFVVGDAGEDSIAAFAQGRAAMAIGSSHLARSFLLDRSSVIADKVACVPIPGSPRVYDHVKAQWTARPDGAVNTAPLVEGWLAAVSLASPHTNAAFDFVAYLTGPDWSRSSVVTFSFNLAPYRSSHLKDPSAWSGPAGSVASWLSALEGSLTDSNAVARLRIEGEGEYHGELERQLGRALQGKVTAEQALAETARAWRAITNRHGLDKMRRQYRRSLGMPVID